MTFQDDIDAALTEIRDAFGESVTFTRAGGDPETVTGIFQNAYLHVRPGLDGFDVTTRAPAIGCKLADFSAAPEPEDKFTIGGKVYRVVDVLPDNMGHVLCVLMVAP